MTRCSGLAGARTFPKTASCNGLDSEAPRLRACGQDKGPLLDTNSADYLRRGMDSVLEAFKHHPTDGSFSPLAAQLSENTEYLNQRVPSY